MITWVPSLEDIAKWWDDHPCNARHSSAPVGSLQHSVEVTKKKLRAEPHLLPFADPNTWKGKRVLDAGCGLGTVAFEYEKAGAFVVGIDASAESIRIAKARNKALGASVNLAQLYLEQYVARDPFDLAWCWGVLHHTPFPDMVLRSLRKSLVPGGTLKLMVYHRHSLKAVQTYWKYLLRHQPLDFDLEKAIRWYSEANTGCPWSEVYTPTEICRVVEAAGFEVKSCRVDHIFRWDIPSYTQGEWVEAWWVRALPRAAFRWLERNFGWHILVEATK